MNAKDYRAMADKVNEEVKAKIINDAKNYINAVVEPTVLVKANKGLYDCSIDVPTTIDIDTVAEMLDETYGFTVGWDGEEWEENNRVLNLMW